MKKLMFFACAMLVCAMANAQIVKGTVGNGNYTDYEGQTTAAYGLDFNNDGNLEFKLDSGEYYGTGFANYSATYRWADSTNIVSDAATWDLFKFLNAGDTINAASGFNGQGDASISTVFQGDRYVGFRIGCPDGMHYGYAKFHFYATAVEWSEIYYNATAGAPIVVGETVTPCTVTLNISGEGGTVEGADDYVYGDTVTLVAVANQGYDFQEWTTSDTTAFAGLDLTQDTLTFVIKKNVELTAVFVAHTSIEEVMGEKAVAVKAKKYMIDGRLYIERNGIVYDEQGRIVRR